MNRELTQSSAFKSLPLWLEMPIDFLKDIAKIINFWRICVSVNSF